MVRREYLAAYYDLLTSLGFKFLTIPDAAGGDKVYLERGTPSPASSTTFSTRR